MGLVAQCECGKRTGVADAAAGKYIRCSGCGNEVYVAAASAAAGGTGKSAKPKSSEPRVAISPTLVTAGIILGVLGVVWAIFYFGPWRVGNDWAAMSSRANDAVTDVILFSLQAYENQHAWSSNSKYVHNTPQLQGAASFVPPMMAFTMPQRIIFVGKTNRGNYSGTYNTTSGEVEATIETGGMSVGGLVDVRKATGSFRITGREKDGKCSAECDGKPLVMFGPHIDDTP